MMLSKTTRMMTLALVGSLLLASRAWAHIPWADLTPEQREAREHLCADIQANDKWLEIGVDHYGGHSASDTHSMFTPTKNRAEKMGKEYRESVIALSRGTPYNRSAPVVRSCAFPIKCDGDDIFRSADGSCNNLQHTDWGKSLIPMRRYVPSQYANTSNAPRTIGKNGQPLPSARKVSTTLHALDSESTENADVTHMTMQFGQFLDHDITLTPTEKGSMGATIDCCSPMIADLIANGSASPRSECFPIDIPDDDDHFSGSCMNFVRSVKITNENCDLLPGEQMNQISAFVDGSQVYGSDMGDQWALRSGTGGLLKVTGQGVELLPKASNKDCVTSEAPNFCFRAGDARVDEQMGLTSMHTIWMREHNRIARELARINNHWDDEQLFQEARRIVGAMLQHITYTEWLPIILSQSTLDQYNLGESDNYSNSYDPSVDPSIRNAFATAAYRFGHSMIKTNFGERDTDYNDIEDLRLTTSFGNTSIIIQSMGTAVNTLLRGLTDEKAQGVDRFFSREIRDLLFLDAQGRSFDLMALNIQRGRDHGIQGYNAWRKFCGLTEAKEFNTGENGFVDHSEEVVALMSSLYDDPDDIDLFAAGISETHQGEGLLGPTFSCIVARQFRMLKVGDRFWYETPEDLLRFTKYQLDELHQVSLARVICDNTDTTNIQPNVFRAVSSSNARTNCDGHEIPKLNLDHWVDPSDRWGPWSPFTDCEDNRRNRTRECLSKDGEKAKMCKGLGFQEKHCGTDCDLGKWSKWGKCVTGCRFRHRSCHCLSCKEGDGFEAEKCGDEDNDKCHEVYLAVKEWYEFGDCGLCH